MGDEQGNLDLRSEDKELDGKDKSKRRFFGLGKRKESSDKTTSTTAANGTDAGIPTISTTSVAPQIPQSTINTVPLDLARSVPSSPPRGSQAQLSSSTAASPGRSPRLRSPSPRLHSPAPSLIFERNVQESTIPDNMSATGIPSHIQVEDHIPPVLDASSLAITDDQLGPDEVEILMHSAHQPAAEKVVPTPASLQQVASAATSDPSLATSAVPGLSPVEDLPPESLHQRFTDQFAQAQSATSHPSGDTTNNLSSSVAALDGSDSYAHGSAEPADVRRLSFISFADVVQSEHRDAEVQSLRERDSTHILRSQSPIPAVAVTGSDGNTMNQSPSPTQQDPTGLNGNGQRGGGASPPPVGSPGAKALNISTAVNTRGRGVIAGSSPTSPVGHPGSSSSRLEPGAQTGSEILVQTMRETLRRTGSGDLGVMLAKSEGGGG